MFSEQTEPVSRPIFIIGSPRSGTSILSWCLGQHPNIFVTEESNWLGDFSLDLACRYGDGANRGVRTQLFSLGVTLDSFLSFFGKSAGVLIRSHFFEMRKNDFELSKRDSSEIDDSFKYCRSADDPKQRWVDGTPEYSFHVYGLLKLFGQAKFIHIVRDVNSVVQSMLGFDTGTSRPLVSTEQEAYEYWLRTVKASLQAERAYGSRQVLRVRYRDLIDRPEDAICAILDFLGEPFSPFCVEPLHLRINSSRPISKTAAQHGSQTDLAVIQEAEQLSRQMQDTGPEPLEPDPYEAHALADDFAARVKYRAGQEADLEHAREIIDSLNAELLDRARWAKQLDAEIARLRKMILEPESRPQKPG
jgi:hypothetical protein